MSRPEDRYVKLETTTLPSGRVVYKTARPRQVLIDEDTDLTLTGNEKDRMDILASNVYGDAGEWWRIAAANRHVNGSLHVKPNTDITLPRKKFL
jgi:hypothetical protein